MSPQSTHCPTCGAPAVRRCANGHPLPPGYNLCSACGAFAAAPASATAPDAPSDNTWVYVWCGLAVLLATVLVAVLVLRSTGPVATAAAPTPVKTTPTTAPTTSTTRPRLSTTTTTRSRGGTFDITPERLKAELRQQGMPAEQADCIVDGLVDEGIDLSTFANPTDEEQRLLVEIATRCASGG